MTVKELKEKLNEFDEDLKVFISSYSGATEEFYIKVKVKDWDDAEEEILYIVQK